VAKAKPKTVKKTAKKKVEKFADDEVSNRVCSQYGDIVESGDKVLDDLTDLDIIGFSPALNMALGGGLREGSCVVMSGDPKTGKEQPISATVYTTFGPKKMGDIKEEDFVCTPDGRSARVIGVYPQGVKDVYKLTLSDGTFVECGVDHLWKVQKNYHGRHKDWEILTLRDIMNQGIYYSDRPKWKIPLTAPASFSKRHLVIPAYIMGCLLGDGSISQSCPKISSADASIVRAFEEYCEQIGLNCRHDGNYDYVLSHPDNKNGDNQLTSELRNLGLFGKTSHTKFIPYDYNYSSVGDRLELARGLMDTDGYNDKGITAEYTTVSEALSKDVAELLQSLGYHVTTKQRTTRCNGKEFPSFRLHISGANISNLFSLARKKTHSDRKKPDKCRLITKIEKVRKEESQCIEIDHEDHLYLTNGFTVTHNTVSSLHFAAKCQKLGKPIVYFNTEGRLVKENFTGINGLDASKIKVVQTTESKPLISAEEYLNTLETYIKSEPGVVAIVDSVSSMLPQAELEGEIRAGVRNNLPRLMAMFLKRVSGDVTRNKAIVIFILHNIANTGGSMFAAKKMADSGNMVQYQAGTNMMITHRGKWVKGGKKKNEDDGDGGEHIGQVANWKIITSASGGTPNSLAASYIRYGIGIDEAKEIADIARELTLIKVAGSWFTIIAAVNDVEDPRVKAVLDRHEVDATDKEAVEKFFRRQGDDPLMDLINDNPELVDYLSEKVEELF
jgi:RecA/RadA recombinase